MADYRNDLTKVIYELESSSGKNKAAYRPNSVGALGGYQLTPIAYNDIKAFRPDKWSRMGFRDVASNDQLANEAATDYLMLLSNRLTAMGIEPNTDNLLWAYHSGAGNVAKNNIGPIGREYVAKARALAGIKPHEQW